jgi:hypothetical protein
VNHKNIILNKDHMLYHLFGISHFYLIWNVQKRQICTDIKK